MNITKIKFNAWAGVDLKYPKVANRKEYPSDAVAVLCAIAEVNGMVPISIKHIGRSIVGKLELSVFKGDLGKENTAVDTEVFFEIRKEKGKVM